MTFEWVIASYSGEKAKTVRAHIAAGLGYFLVDELPNGALRVAFKRAIDSPTPLHCSVIADDRLIAKLDDKDRQRKGAHDLTPAI